ncbi:hypothetical protein GJ697_28245 [Pseudoduganella sp. FT25W]|uniref:Uncharacterized protein n=1 Tax=Duganella alba TaxID=2666081 RepID=A0A6L5QPD3_9BURK|nr:hypothetical protein [Duganella alba]MRX11726.1 hypothetical protein [Duganella alba]MRX20117.1 hypothetical protein [Duganella alba]
MTLIGLPTPRLTLRPNDCPAGDAAAALQVAPGNSGQALTGPVAHTPASASRQCSAAVQR